MEGTSQAWRRTIQIRCKGQAMHDRGLDSSHVGGRPCMIGDHTAQTKGTGQEL
jgi:hypothetical protein